MQGVVPKHHRYSPRATSSTPADGSVGWAAAIAAMAGMMKMLKRMVADGNQVGKLVVERDTLGFGDLEVGDVDDH